MFRAAAHLLAAIAVLGLLLVAPLTAQAAPVGKKQMRGHIVNGLPSQNLGQGGFVPWQVGLVNLENGQPETDRNGAIFIFCGGTIRDATHIITAAHCVPDSNAADIAVVNSLIFRSAPSASGTEIKRVAAITTPPQYVSPERGSDLAVLTLAEPLTKGSTRAIGTSQHDQPGTSAFISGWGHTSSGGQSPDQLQVAQIQVLGPAACGNYGSDFSETMLCAGAANQFGPIDSCQGDSGGPLVSSATGHLIGVVSWGKGCADPQFPGVYAKLSHPDLNARANAANPAPRAEPVDGASIQGTPTVGQTLSCAPGQWRNHSGDFIFTWLSAVRGADGKFSDVRPETGGPTLALTDAHANRVVGCAATSVGPGGARQSGANVVAVGAAPVPAAAPPAPPVAIPGDLIAPTSRFTRRSCKKRRCSLTITASDSGGPATSVRVTYQRISGCRKGKKGAKCRKTKTLKAKKRGKGVFTVTTPKLAPARYRFTVIATDASGNRSKKRSVVLRVKR